MAIVGIGPIPWDVKQESFVPPIHETGLSLFESEDYKFESEDYKFDHMEFEWLSVTKLEPEDHKFDVVRVTESAWSISACLAKEQLSERCETKIKQGLAGFANGSSISAIADTGSRKNVISASYAARLGLKIEDQPSSFTLGNSRKVYSTGTVSLSWSFAKSPKEAVSIICHVLPHCIYDLILGNGFLTITETMSRFRYRLTQCIFTIASKLPSFAFLGETCQRLEGVMADDFDVLAVPDSGAERNVMDLRYAIDHGFSIGRRPRHRIFLQFADGSSEITVGRVRTHWRFANGKRIPIRFEVLENCCSDVIIGEEVLTHHNVFEQHASSLVTFEPSPDSYELAPFDFIQGWQRALGMGKGRTPKNGLKRIGNPEVEERRRRDIWNHEHNYGANATTIEKELEKERRAQYDLGISKAVRRPIIPSIPTAPSRHRRPQAPARWHRTAQAPNHRSEDQPRR